ncbi:MAG TPA: hypothetical protein VGD96_23395 [Bradyrhizobium sp.]
MARNRAFERPESIAEREAGKVFQSIDRKSRITEYSLAQKAFHDNRERLKAERLAREAVVTAGKAINQSPGDESRDPGDESREKQAVLREWDLWIQTQPLQRSATGRDARKFFLQLRARRPPGPLDFPARGQDKWQIVRGWLLDAQRLERD